MSDPTAPLGPHVGPNEDPASGAYGDSIERLAARVAALEASGPGGSAPSVGAPSWFQNADTPSLTDGVYVQPQWGGLTDGVALGTDVVVHSDPTKLKVVTPGTYLLSWFVHFAVGGLAANAWAEGESYPELNADAVGPAYYVAAAIPLGPGSSGGNQETGGCIPLVLAANDLIGLNVRVTGATLDLGDAHIVLLKLA